MPIEKYLQSESKSIVFLGDFNPIILQPYWLFSKGLIREEEAKTANVALMHDEIAKYNLDWIGIEINKKKCIFSSTKSPYFEPMKDLSSSVFKILKETPIRKLGINHTFDLKLPNKEAYFNFGDMLSPLNNWNNSLNDPKLLLLEIVESERKDGLKGSYRVRIAPSEPHIDFGVNININDHFELPNNLSGTNMEIIKYLEENWNNSNKRAKETIENILTKTNL